MGRALSLTYYGMLALAKEPTLRMQSHTQISKNFVFSMAEKRWSVALANISITGNPIKSNAFFAQFLNNCHPCAPDIRAPQRFYMQTNLA